MATARATAPGIVVAPDTFKGTFTATEVAGALAAGMKAAGARATCLPIGDGGEGTMDALVATLGGRIRTARVADPLGRPVLARFGLAGCGRVGLVETAEASGL